MSLTLAADTEKTLPRRFKMKQGEVRNVLVSFARVLDSGELISTVDDVTAAAHEEDQDSDLLNDDDELTIVLADAVLITDSNNATNTAAETIEEEGVTVAIGQGAVFTLSAVASQTVGVWNRITVTVTTTATNPQVLKQDMLVKVVDR